MAARPHLRRTRADGIAGQAAPDEDDEAVETRDAVPAECERLDLQLELLVSLDRRRHAARRLDDVLDLASSEAMPYR